MSEETAHTKKSKLTESDILASLESAISSYEKKDFEQIAKQSLSKSKGVKRSKKKAIVMPTPVVEEETVVAEEQYFEEDPLEAAKEVMEVVHEKKKKTKSTKKSKAKAKTTKRKRKGLFSRLKASTPTKDAVKGYAVSSYRRHLVNATLTLMMVGFVSFSSYIAYAYVSGNSGDVVGKVGSHVVLPESETPKIYIIQSEKSEIFQNPMFKGIKVGDNVLSYPKAGKVIIYRGGEDKVVNIVNTAQ